MSRVKYGLQDNARFTNKILTDLFHVLKGLLCRQLKTPCLNGCKGNRLASSSAGNKLYELRTYKIWPKDFKAYMELTKEQIHLRTNHSPLIGFWVSEIGGLNEVIHIWEYDSLSHRASVRQSLAQDPDWYTNYISTMLTYLERQENCLLRLTTDNRLSQPNLKGVYSLEVIADRRPGESQCKGDTELLGGFSTVIGSTYMGYRLWYHKDVDAMLEHSWNRETPGDSARTVWLAECQDDVTYGGYTTVWLWHGTVGDLEL